MLDLLIAGIVERSKSINLRKMLRGDNFQICGKVLTQRYDSSATERVKRAVSQTAAALLSLDTQVSGLEFVICNRTFLTIILTSCSDNLSLTSISSGLWVCFCLFLFLATPLGMQDPSFLTREGTCDSMIGSVDSYSLDHQGRPPLLFLLLFLI